MNFSRDEDLTSIEFWKAIQEGNLPKAKALLETNPAFAMKNFQPDSLHTDGFPLFQATKQGNLAMVKLLLEHGADPDAKLGIDDPRETGMPLMNAFHGGHFDIVNLLLDHGASVFAFPYCSTPFVDCVHNATWNFPEQVGVVGEIIRKSFGNYLSPEEGNEVRMPELSSAPEMIRLLGRAVEMGGQPSLFTVVRHEPMDLIEELLRNAANEPGTRMDWPQGTVFENLCYGASWTGYPAVLELCLVQCPELYTVDVAKLCIERALRSHNRDGGIDEYETLIRSQLEFLKKNDALTESYSNGKPFLPLHWLANDFIEPRNYGFKCPDLSTPEDLNRLASLFIEFGFSVTAVCPETDLTPLQAAEKANQTEYADLLKQAGAD